MGAYGYDRDIGLARSFARQADLKLSELKVDCIVSPRSYPIALLNTHLPVACWGDATYHALREIYPEHKGVARTSIRQGDYIEKRAFNRCFYMAFSSNWAMKDAVEYYGASPERCEVIPFGSNNSPVFETEAAMFRSVTGRTKERLNLLFVGVDWKRKGGDIVLEAHLQLIGRGIPSHLTIVGCNPFESTPMPERVSCLGYLSKANPVHRALLHQAYSEAHVFFMPTRAECYGVVFAEAASYALPVLSTRTGGVADAVSTGETGLLLGESAPASEYADVLAAWHADRRRYEDLSTAAWGRWSSCLNWSVAGARFSNSLSKQLAMIALK
jgi:glycosyltransferase involved in cell wall biosynthesis